MGAVLIETDLIDKVCHSRLVLGWPGGLTYPEDAFLLPCLEIKFRKTKGTPNEAYSHSLSDQQCTYTPVDGTPSV